MNQAEKQNNHSTVKHEVTKADKIAEEVIAAMGGLEAWNQIENLEFDFFGVRKIYWNKPQNIFRIVSIKPNAFEYLIDVNNKTGEAKINGQHITQNDSLAHALDKAYSIAINDSYWLAMPFKLKDKGVHLSFSRMDTLNNGHIASVLDMTFDNVGITPSNKYEIFVDGLDNLVKKWHFYTNNTDSLPRGKWPFDNYKRFDGVLLSSDRSDNSGIRSLKVNQQYPKDFFTKL